MKIARSVSYWLFVCCVPIFILTSNIHCGVSMSKLYQYGFNKYQIDQVTGIDELELKMVARHLADYFNARIDSAQITVVKESEDFNLFNEREIVHLQDIRGLIKLDRWIQWGSLAIMIICSLVLLLRFRSTWRILGKGLYQGSLATLGFMIILALWAVFGFEQLFLLFHLISFSNQFWILDPARDYLIMLFPEGFFYDVALFGFAAVMLQALVLGGIAFGILKSTGSKS